MKDRRSIKLYVLHMAWHDACNRPSIITYEKPNETTVTAQRWQGSFLVWSYAPLNVIIKRNELILNHQSRIDTINSNNTNIHCVPDGTINQTDAYQWGPIICMGLYCAIFVVRINGWIDRSDGYVLLTERLVVIWSICKKDFFCTIINCLCWRDWMDG